MTTMVKEKIGVKTLDDLVEWAYYNGHRVSEIAGVAEVVEKAAKVGDKTGPKDHENGGARACCPVGKRG